MAEARRRVHERFGVELEHEVRFLGPLELPPLVRWSRAGRGEQAAVAPPPESDRARRGPCRCARLAPGRSRRYLPSAALAARRPSRSSASAAGAYVARARDVALRACASSRSTAASPRCRPRCATALAPELGRSLVAVRGGELEQRLVETSPACSRFASTARFPHTLRVRRHARSGRCCSLRRGKDGWRRRRRAAACSGGSPTRGRHAAARLGAEGRRRSKRRHDARAGERRHGAPPSSRRSSAATFPARVRVGAREGRRADARARLGARAPARRQRRPAPEARDRARSLLRRCDGAETGARVPRRQRARAPGRGRRTLKSKVKLDG